MEKKILRAFLQNHRLKFNEIEKITKIRSNKLTYHLKKLIDKNILTKKAHQYELTEASEHLIPYISDKKHVLSVVLIHLGNSKQAFMHKRDKRPFKDKLGFPGGRNLLGETISESVKRIMEEKHNINAKLKTIHSISIESIKKSKKIIQTDLIVFVTATTKNKIPLTDIEKNKGEIISSDYKLLKNDLNKEIKIKSFLTKD